MFPTERLTTAPFEPQRSPAKSNLTRFGNLSGLSALLEAPLLLFLLTALLGVATAYDSGAAWHKLVLIAGGLLLFFFLACQPPEATRWLPIGAGLAALPALAGAYFLLAQSILPLPQFHPNVMAGIMALLLPYTPAFAAALLRRRQAAAGRRQTTGRQLLTTATLLLTAAALALTAVALLFTGSRGAILGLSTVACLWLFWRLRRRLLLLLFSATICATLLAPALAPLPPLPAIAGALAPRLQLFRQTLYLIADFPLTGAGLGAFPGLYAEYILAIPHYALPSSHNLFLDVALEQGLVGLLAFGAMLLGALWLLLRAPQTEPAGARPLLTLRHAAVASIVVLLVHGLVDDPIYSSKALPLLFIAPGIAAGFAKQFRGTAAGATRNPSPRHPLTRPPFPSLAVLTTALALTLAFLLSPAWQAKWFSNLGALQMARVQLAQWPTGAWSDGREAAYLGAAETHFHRSLALDPHNSTARHRLGLIAMMRRDYAMAVGHLSIAHADTPGHDGIRKRLGYSHLWARQPQQALALLQGLPGIRGEMQSYAHWWKEQDRPDLAAVAGAMLTALQENASAGET